MASQCASYKTQTKREPVFSNQLGPMEAAESRGLKPIPDTLGGLNWDPFRQPSLDEAMRGIDWETLCQLASDLKNGTPCTLLPMINAGLNNLIRVVQFEDGTQWVARIPLHLGKQSDKGSIKLRTEVHTMQLINESCGSDLPVPRIFAYEADTNNRVGVPFILMELIAANTAMDSAGGYPIHRGVIPPEYRLNFHRSVARFHVSLIGPRLRFPRIGTITRVADADGGGFDIGPLPDLGGPFETASAFLEAWANNVKFRKTREEIIRMMPANQPLAERVAEAIENFPAQIKALVAHRPPSALDNGPFPLVHADFLHSNILVDSDFNAIGLIDWEGAQTVPWEFITYPRFLEAMPPAFDLPANYDDSGQPLDEETRELWRERERYVELVQAAERMAEGDGMLSASLGNDAHQALAYCMMAYDDIGKLGFYDSVVEQLRNHFQ